MKIYSVQSESSSEEIINFRDKKRYWWLGGVIYPMLPVFAVLMYMTIQSEWLLILPLFAFMLAVPIVDMILGTNKSNPSELLTEHINSDPFYRNLLIAAIPVHFAAVIIPAYLIASAELSIIAYLFFSIAVALYSGFSINTAHEIGHKTSKLDRLLSRVALSVTGYGHFCVDHNAGHHRDVSTPEDCASSRMGESIYRFALREIPGAFKRGWEFETKRLSKKGVSVWSRHNHILQSYAMTLLWQGSLVLILGLKVVPFLILHNVIAWFQLTSANYIEHYGLLRSKKVNDRYERCQPHHSWNSNHIFSNLLLFQLQRHSDHHANPSRPYQSLRSFESLPELPAGYLGMYFMAYLPPLWFKVMDKRLLAIQHIDGDLEKVNLDPKNADKIRRRYGLLAAADRKRQGFTRLFS